MIYCKDCKWGKRSIFFFLEYMCNNPKLGKDLTTGKQIIKSCRLARIFNCKEEAIWFEEKQKKQFIIKSWYG